jgi:predicted lipoprotein with Yx(FWY)xxD motif
VRLALPLTAALAVAACGGTPSGGGGGGAGSSAPSSPATGSQAAATGTVITTKSGPSGNYLTDGSGRAVYFFMADSTDKTRCTGPCLAAWPAVYATGTPSASGSALSANLGAFTRPNGKKQMTYKGLPLYYFAGDTGAGMTAGQGISQFGAKWWLVSPAGAPLKGSGSSGGSPGPSSSAGSTWG